MYIILCLLSWILNECLYKCHSNTNVYNNNRYNNIFFEHVQIFQKKSSMNYIQMEKDSKNIFGCNESGRLLIANKCLSTNVKGKWVFIFDDDDHVLQGPFSQCNELQWNFFSTFFAPNSAMQAKNVCCCFFWRAFFLSLSHLYK